MLHIALWEPEIPPNTGNIARLCAATGTTLHLIGRLGFQMDDKSLRRAGIDYWPSVKLFLHADMESCRQALAKEGSTRIFCFSAHARQPYTAVKYEAGDVLLFGSESRGLPPEILAADPSRTLVIPMPSTKVRSLNLSTSAGIVLYEALRQLQIW